MVLWKFSLREMLNRPVRATLTLLSIIIGVGIIVSASIATQTTRVAYRDMFNAVSGRADLEVVAQGGGNFDSQVLDSVARTPGVEAAVPTIQRLTIMFAHGKRTKLLVLGVDPAVDDAVRQCKIVAGRPLDPTEGLLLEDGLARSMGIHVGDEVKFLAGHPMPRATVTGLVSSPLRMASTALMPKNQTDAATTGTSPMSTSSMRPGAVAPRRRKGDDWMRSLGTVLVIGRGLSERVVIAAIKCVVTTATI